MATPLWNLTTSGMLKMLSMISMGQVTTYHNHEFSLILLTSVKVDFMGERVTVELARGTPHGRDKER